MTSIPAGIAVQQGQERLDFALSTIKKNAESEQAVANLLEDALLSGNRGSNVNFRV